ncbi:MAG TPA: hypothetical protein VEC17_03190 [Candidatus Binatia bacterium]|nr:hypothetical protein [Candidatus Binatia bacterium]
MQGCRPYSPSDNVGKRCLPSKTFHTWNFPEGNSKRGKYEDQEASENRFATKDKQVPADHENRDQLDQTKARLDACSECGERPFGCGDYRKESALSEEAGSSADRLRGQDLNQKHMHHRRCIMMFQAVIVDGRVLVEKGRDTLELSLDRVRHEYMDQNGQYYRLDGPLAAPIQGVPPVSWASRLAPETRYH